MPKRLDAEELRRAYAQVFASEQGRVVLDDLMTQFYHVPMYPEADYRAGRHDVLLYIREHIERGQTND